MSDEVLKWWCASQNNSGGYFVQDENVAEEVFIQAPSYAVALDRANEITDPSGEDWCECCGERWETLPDAPEDRPMIYGKPLEDVKADWLRSEARLHYADGRVEAYKYAEPKKKNRVFAPSVYFDIQGPL